MRQKKQLPKRKHKASLTIIELFIVIALIAITAGVIAIPIKNALIEERFQSNVDIVIGKIKLAQEIMIDYDSDVFLHLDAKEEGVSCRLIPSVQLPAPLMKTLNKDCLLKDFTAFSFRNEPQKHCELQFFSNSLSSHGELTFFGKNASQAILYLPGYPAKISKNKHLNYVEKAPYPKNVQIKKA